MIGYIAGYIARHWRGQLPLTQSFGLGALVMVPFALWFALAANAIASHSGTTPSTLILTIALPFSLFVLADIWGAVGIWVGLSLAVILYAALLVWRFHLLTKRGYLPALSTA